MRLTQLIAIAALALVGLALADNQYASASHPHVAAIVQAPQNQVVQRNFGPLGRLRSETIVNGGNFTGAVAIQQQFRPVFRPAVAVRAPFTNVFVGNGSVAVRAPFTNLVVSNQPAFVNSQLLVDPRFRTQLNVLNTYNYPTNTAANILYRPAQTVILQDPQPTQYLIQPAAQPAQVVDPPVQYQKLPDPQPQSALPVQALPLAVTQPARVIAVTQPAPAPIIAVTQPVYGVRVNRFGLALRGC